MRARELLALVAVAALAGCNGPGDEATLTAARIEGAIAIGDAFVLDSARLSLAPRDEQALGSLLAPVLLAEPPGTARTNLTRDHWVLDAILRERAPGAGAGNHTARLDWNGEDAGAVHLQGPANGTSALAARVRFDLGAAIAPSNVYAFEISRGS